MSVVVDTPHTAVPVPLPPKGGARLDALLRTVVPAVAARGDADLVRRARLLVALCAVVVVWGPILAGVYWTLGLPLLATGNAIASVAVIAPLLALRRTGSLALAGNLATADLAWILLFDAATQGGIRAPSFTWFALVPILALLLASRRSGLVWCAVMTVGVATILVLGNAGVLPDPPPGSDAPIRLFLVIGGAVVVTTSVAIVYQTIKEDTLAALASSNAELVASRDEAQAASRAKSQFLAHMSHEIRTPMTAVLGYADLLCDDEVSNEERREHGEILRRNGAHLLAVVNDILDLSRLTERRIDLEQLECSPVSLVDATLALFQSSASEKGLGLAVEYRGELPARIVTDPTRFRQILMNLVSNAIKFTTEGGVRVVVEGSAAAPGQSMLRFDVIDTGIGMTTEQRRRLFAPFAQGDASMTRRFGGTGLGLAISKGIAEALGGSIEVTSEPGRGSTFTFRLGVTVCDGERSAVPVGYVCRETAGVELPLPLRVLLAEDVLANQRLISLLLRRAGVDVQTADDGTAAVAAVLAAEAAHTPFDVVLMDMQMPRLDGYGATAELRAAGYARPIVALTAHAMSGERERCLAAGCDDFATKPIDGAALLATIRRQLDLTGTVATGVRAHG